MNAPTATAPGVSPEEIAVRAYQLYVDAGSPEGQDIEHWVRAEAQLVAEKQSPFQQSVILEAIRHSA